MKKLLFYLMAMPVVCLFVACSESNNELTGNDVIVKLTSANLTEDGYFDGLMYYKITSNSPQEVTVNKAEKSAVMVEIPTVVRIDGTSYKCTSISENAFSGCWNLTSISIPNSIISIGETAFYHCNLIKVTIPNSVTAIGYGAFAYCSHITEMTIPNSVVSIGDAVFSSCI